VFRRLRVRRVTKEKYVKIAYLGVLLFGIVSLSGDLIYEGARSIIPQYLYNLGAPALIVGTVIGLGEFLGYGLRLASGYLADKLKSYWFFTIVGYLLLISIPLMAFTNNWYLVLLLVLIERFAKAIRSPARDTLLSQVSKSIGSGKAFGLHELMDQIGAIGGPAIVSIILYITGDFSKAFMILTIPYLLLVLSLSTAYHKLKPYTLDFKEKRTLKGSLKLPIKFYLYAISVLVNTAGLIHVALIIYKESTVLLPWLLSTLYLFIQAIDAIFAPIAGLAYDKFGRRVLIIPFLLSIFPSILVFASDATTLVIIAIIYGIVLGMQESIYRAAVADIAPLEYRVMAYGIFYVTYGIGFTISGAVYGFLIDINAMNIAIPYAIISQVIALFLLLKSIT